MKSKKGINLGEKNAMWKGDDVGYNALHDYIKYHKPKPGLCECCSLRPPYDLANISGEYKRDVDDYEWICRKCHMKKDGRGSRLRFIRPHTEEEKKKMSDTLNLPEVKKCMKELAAKRERNADGTFKRMDWNKGAK